MQGFETDLVRLSDVDICIKRIYEKPVRRDGYRILVDRLWPRMDALRERATQQRVTLLYAARDKTMNHAVVLEEAIRTRSVHSGAEEHPNSTVKLGDADPD